MILLGKEDSCDTFSFSIGIFVDLISRLLSTSYSSIKTYTFTPLLTILPILNLSFSIYKTIVGCEQDF